MFERISEILARALGGLRSWQEMRIHQRFPIWKPELAHAEISEKKFKIVDLSYGGIALDLPADNNVTWRSGPKAFQITLFILDQSFMFNANLVYARDNAIGFQFHHAAPDGLDFLRTSLENMRRGSLLNVDVGVDEDLPVVVQGDDGTTLEADLGTSANDCKSLVLSFIDQHCRHTITLKADTLHTNTDLLQEGSQLIKMSRTSKPALRQGVLILLGMQNPIIRSHLQTPIARIVDALCSR